MGRVVSGDADVRCMVRWSDESVMNSSIVAIYCKMTETSAKTIPGIFGNLFWATWHLGFLVGLARLENERNKK